MKKLLFTAIAVSLFNLSYSQNITQPLDTIKISLENAEQRFVDRNLAVLAAKYDIDIASAILQQSKIWYNPNISYSQGVYNPVAKKYTTNGEHDVQLRQLFSIAGKHTNAVRLAKLQAEKSSYAFNEVLRGLKFELYTNFSSLFASQQKINLYRGEILNLNRLIKAADQQFQLGAIAGNEVIRLRAELQNIKNDLLTTLSELEESEKNLKILLDYRYDSFLIATDLPFVSNNMPTLEEMITAAEKNRPDLNLSHTEIAYQKQNLSLQRSTAVPDLSLAAEYDQASASVPNFYGAGVSMDIPLFNRNQGGIYAAKKAVEKSKLLDSLTMRTVRSEVISAYSRIFQVKNLISDLDPKYSDNIEQLLEYATINYNKRYISLLEFLDQLRTYTNAKQNLIETKSTYFNSIHYLNYITGTDIIK